MKAELSERVMKQLADYFNLPLANTAMPGTTLLPDAELTPQSWITLWPVGQRIVVQIAPELLPPLKDMLAACESGHCLTVANLQRVWSDVPLMTEALKVYFRDPQDCQPITMPDGFAVRRLTMADAATFTAFQARCPAEDREVGDVGLDHEVAFGVLDGERIAAAASVYEWYSFKDIGVITDPAYRRKGLGRAVVAAICEYYRAQPEPRILVYRHLKANIGSQHIAESLGFQRYTTLESIRRVMP